MIHALQPFCPQFNPRVANLLHAVMQAHADAAAKNFPISTTAAIMQAQAGKPMESAVIAAINTVGAKHAPVTETRGFWCFELHALNHSGWKDSLRARLAVGQRIPGFGHSIHKDKIAPELESVDKMIREQFPMVDLFLNEAVAIVQEAKPTLHPNMALYTALACELAQMRFGVESLIFIFARLPVWAAAWNNEIASAHKNQPPQ